MREIELLDELQKDGLVLTDMVDIGRFKDVNWKDASVATLFQFCKANERWLDPGISWWELAALHLACEEHGRVGVYVETGQCWGCTTRYFAARTIRHGGSLYSIELVTRPKFDEATIEVGIDKQINTIRGHSQKISWDKYIDIIWIDSEHALPDALGEYMKYRLWFTQGTLVGFHDTENCYGVKRTTEIIQEIDDLELLHEIPIGYGAGTKIYKVKNMNNAWIRKNQEIQDIEIKAINDRIAKYGA